MQISELSDRAREVFRLLIDSYLTTGEPVGSRIISARMHLSPASIRSVMADLEERGLLVAPHTSAGRMPTDLGLRLFIDGLLQVGDLTQEQQEQMSSQAMVAGKSLPQVLNETTTMLSGLAACASLVVAPKTDFSLRQIDFVLLSPRQVLVVLVGVHGQVENRVIETQQPLSPAQLQMAANYLNHQATGKKLSEVQALVAQDMAMQRAQLDALTQKVVQSGLAVWSEFGGGQLIVKGHAQLLKDVQAVEDIERIRQLFDALEVKENLWRLVGDAESAEGVKIFIGTEHPVFQQSGCSLVVAPFGRHSSGHMVGAIGVIGPTRLNYARIIPLVDFTAKLMDKVLGQDP